MTDILNLFTLVQRLRLNGAYQRNIPPEFLGLSKKNRRGTEVTKIQYAAIEPVSVRLARHKVAMLLNVLCCYHQPSKEWQGEFVLPVFQASFVAIYFRFSQEDVRRTNSPCKEWRDEGRMSKVELYSMFKFLWLII